MTIAQKIEKKIKDLPETIQEKVLKYINDLSKEKDKDDRLKAFSLNQAMKGIENDEVSYDEKDLKAKWI